MKDMVGGGPFHLGPAQWTDDTAMALCLASCLVGLASRRVPCYKKRATG
jgi:ADP-ribosylglycohydrolase